jgi:hypothetical protein
MKAFAIPVLTVISAVIYGGAISGSSGQSIAEVEDCSHHMKSSMELGR